MRIFYVYRLYFVSAYIVMRYIKLLHLFIYLYMAIIPFVYHLFVCLFGVCFAGFVCLFARCVCLLKQTIHVYWVWPVLVSRRWPLTFGLSTNHHYYQRRNDTDSYWSHLSEKSMIFQSHHVLFCFTFIYFFLGGGGWGGYVVNPNTVESFLFVNVNVRG